MDDVVMFIPACGLGTRVAQLGHKPFIMRDPENMALECVLRQTPHDMPVEIALRAGMGCPALSRDVIVHFFAQQTNGQAHTIYRWLKQRAHRNAEWILISNCDNEIDGLTVQATIEQARESKDLPDGYVFTFEPQKIGDARFSYVELSGHDRIVSIAEKTPISQHACAGVYLLNATELKLCLKEEDIFLSEALARMHGLYAVQCQEYHGWGDMQQIAELNNDVKQYR